MKILEKKDDNSKKDYQMKEKILKKGFHKVVNVLIRNVKIQRDLILQSYGPLMTVPKKTEPPIFHINKKIDPKAAENFQKLLHARSKIPQPVQIKIDCARCLKDKVGSGHFIVLVSVLDRIGGEKIKYNSKESESNLRELSKTIREFNLKKKKFVNKEHREMEQKTATGATVMQSAPKTGMNWFKAGGGFGDIKLDNHYASVESDEKDDKEKQQEELDEEEKLMEL